MNTQPSANSDTHKIEVSDSDQETTPQTSTEKPAEPVFTPENQPAAAPKPTAPTPPPPAASPETPATPPSSPPPPAQAPPGEIDTDQYDIANQQPPANQPKNGHPAVIITIVAILFLGLGFGGGFYGYKYIPRLKNWLTTSADTNSTNTTATSNASMKTYTNTKYNYSIDYPDNWFVSPSNDTQTATIQFTSYDPQSTDTGDKVKIVFQDSNGKTLKDWISANNVTSEISATPTTMTIDGQEAYQQNISGATKSISTYVLQETQIMIISYEAPDSEFTADEKTYDQMIQSIKLQ